MRLLTFISTLLVLIFAVTQPISADDSNTNVEKYEFQAEVTRLMDIIINSLYSHRDIFIRELISNSADALDKYRLTALKQGNIADDSTELKIEIIPNKNDNTLTIRDTGIGMSKSDLQKYLGVIASSGTSEFLKAATNSDTNTNSLIGQFGVGFYSVYLVADTVDVLTTSIDGTTNLWRSNADKTYTIETLNNDHSVHGTSVILHLKPDCIEYLDTNTVRKLVQRYSEFISFPIYLQTTTTETVPTEQSDISVEISEKPEQTDELDSVDVDEESSKTDTVETREVTKFEKLNDQPAIWTRNPSDVTDEEYNAFYKVLNKADYNAPLRHLHFKAEGDLAFSALLYVPSQVDPAMYNNLYSTEYKQNLKIYVNKVLISDSTELLPKYLSFIHGVVDTSNFALNVNREVLSENDKTLKQIGNKIKKKIIDLLVKMSNDQEQADEYKKFYDNFAPSIKLGIIDDKSNKAKIAELLRFKSSKHEPNTLISLNDYIAEAQELAGDNENADKNIYYLSCENYDSCNKNIVTERLKKLNYNILYFVDNLDEYAIQNMNTYKKYKFVNIAKENFKIKEISQQQLNDAKDSISTLVTYLSEQLKDKVVRVDVSARAVDSPAVLVSTQYGYSANMERLLKSQSFQDKQTQAMMLMNNKKILEINPFHPIIKQLNQQLSDNSDDTTMHDTALLLYHTAAVTSGYSIEDTDIFASTLNRLLARSIGVSPDAVVEDEIKPLTAEEIKIIDQLKSDHEKPKDGPEILNFNDIDMNDIEGSLAAMNEQVEKDEL